jgi:general secretion pathway protein J
MAYASGFTLVELLISLSLFALIVLLLFSGLRLGTRVWDAADAVAERNAGLRSAYNFLARTLTHLRPARITFDAQDVLLFGGSTEQVEFVAPLSEHVGTPGLYILRLSLEQGDTARLVLTRWLLHPEVLKGVGDNPPWEPLISAEVEGAALAEEDVASGAYGRALLLDRVGLFGISYYGIQEGQDAPTWNAEWLRQDRLPLALRLHVSTVEQSWPDILIRLPEVDPHELERQ